MLRPMSGEGAEGRQAALAQSRHLVGAAGKPDGSGEVDDDDGDDDDDDDDDDAKK